MKLVFNSLAVISSGMFAGVLFAIGVLLGGYWKELSAVAFLDSFNTFLPLVPRAIAVGLVAVVGLTGSVWLSWGDREVRRLWLLAAGCIGMLFILTAVWFAPTNSQFAARSLPLAQVLAKRDMWLMLHSLRIVFAAVASILGIIAVSR
ncbi:DUF1772 domain-containing protein [Spirosoma sp. RP8]|uniref:DUF1772 domain-containing protein n=1 Tax=Spirosoma liriopis TaxID=2937440 RepID=A0ABT0HVF2_9BACT|nr:anthrone oxygenase family protein [Spirosoma liriopis]MCK8495832.1 DUF1772 domain-containing protein [Spirosoma liriopis]